jgi:type VI secretion system protein ImpA
MPLRDDLLDPIAGENPSGVNLYHDKLFDQIKEARTEEVDTGPIADTGRAPKKADHVTVIKLAGDALSKRTKDLRLAAWLIESQFKREGIEVLPGGIALLHKLQENFWETLYPEIEEDGNLELRLVAIEGAANRLGAALRQAPIARNGYSLIDYLDARAVGYESEAEYGSAKAEARQYALQHGKLTAEDFDTAFQSTPKSFYAALNKALEAAVVELEEIEPFQEEKYGSDYPSMGKLRKSLDEVAPLVRSFLNEKRTLEPDPIVDEPEPEPEPEYALEPAAEEATLQEVVHPAAPRGRPAAPKDLTPQQMVVHAAEQIFKEFQNSPAPYLICSGLRFAETRLQPSGGYELAVGPPTEVRQKLVRVANQGEWTELLRESIAMLGEPYGRTWLDLHRYTWRAAQESGYSELAQAIVTTLRGILQDIPEMRTWNLDDDTPVGNQETQRWIDAEILPPPPEPVVAAPAPDPVIIYRDAPSGRQGTDSPPERTVYEVACELQESGRPEEAITMMVREANRQSSGRERFQRRIEVAQLCLASNREDIAYPILSELNAEIDSRNLALWERDELLVKPMTMLLRCMESRGESQQDRDALFTKICRLDPQAAFTVRR